MATPTAQDQRVKARSTASYFRDIVTSILGGPPSVAIASDSQDGPTAEPKLVITLSVADARRIADALNRDPDK